MSNIVTQAAGLILEEMIRSSRSVGFATLEDPETHESSGVVLVCLGPQHVEACVRFVHSLGNFKTVVPDANPK